MKLLPKQEHAVYYLKDNETKELLYGGAAGGGKTAFEVLKVIENCQLYAGSRWLLGRSKLKALKETTLNTFFELTSDLGISNQFVYNSQSNIIYWNNGSEILLKDLFLYPSDPEFDSLGSLEITGAFIDECNQCVYKAWQIVTSRCRYRLTDWDIHGERTDTMKVLKYKTLEDGTEVPVLWLNSRGEETAGLLPKAVGTCNPAKGWTYQKFYKPHKEGKLPKHRKFIQALPTDNPHLPQSYLDTLLSLDESSKQRLYYGNWEFDDNPFALFSYDKICDLFTNSFIKKTGQRYLSGDIAYLGADLFVITIWDGFVIEKVIAIDKIDETAIGAKIIELAEKYRIPYSNIVYDADGLRKFTANSLKRLTAAKPFTNNATPLVGKNYKNIKTECAFKLKELIEAGLIYIECLEFRQQIISNLEQVNREPTDDEGKIKLESKKKYKLRTNASLDFFDSLLMRMIFELKPQGGWS